MATFGRLLSGKRDLLTGFVETELIIEDQTVISISGKAHHTIAKFTGHTANTIPGTVYAVTTEEIERADKYEVAPCKRVALVLQSGVRAWVYVDGRYAPPVLDAFGRAQLCVATDVQFDVLERIEI